MRRQISLLLLGAAALSLVAASPAPAADADTDDVIICVRFRDWDIPFTGITVEKPARRFCVESGEIRVRSCDGTRATSTLGRSPG